MTGSAPQTALERFSMLVRRGRLAHAYLFSGPNQADAEQTALSLAQLVNCDSNHPPSAMPQNTPCGKCSSCRKIASGNHPDIHVLAPPPEGTIKIEDIRQLLNRVSLMAYEARHKVFILKRAHQITTEAANALLKTLEEPPPHTLMLLLSGLPEACLDTIRSRCHAVHFFHMREQWPEDKDDMLDTFLRPLTTDEYLKSLGNDHERIAQSVQVLYGLYRDALLTKSGVPEERLVFPTRVQDACRLASKDLAALLALDTQIVRAKSLLDERLNAKMALNLVRQRLWDN